MNDDTMREQAHERLLTAELAAILSHERPHAAVQWQRLGVAAMVLLGAFVALSVAWVARTDPAPLQHPEFDPVDPWYEHVWPWRSMDGALTRPGRAAEAPADVEEFVVTLRDGDSPDLAAILDRPAVRRLALCWRNDQATPNVTPQLWQRLVTRPELETLLLAGHFAIPAERMRELRLAPELRHLMLFDGAAALDRATAQALVEMPGLRAVGLSLGEVTTEGLAALAGLPQLEALMLSRPRLGVHELMRALPQLRTLRAIVFEGDGMLTTTIDDAALQPLGVMKHLRVLDLSGVKIDDAALTALPTQIELLALPRLDRCTADGVGALRRLTKLRALRLRSTLSTPLQRALLAVIADLPLERYDSLTAAPDAATWQALQSRPKLRWLTLRRQGSPIETIVAGCRDCEHLEHLELFERQLPTPEQLAPLRDHATLRRITFRIDEARNVPLPGEEERLALLRASVRAKIEVVER